MHIKAALFDQKYSKKKWWNILTITFFFLNEWMQVHLNKLECCGKKFIYFSNSTQIVKLVY